MDFDELYKKISPRLKRIAKRHNGHGLFIDGDDLYQEMCIYLWDHYGGGMPDGVNESYIAKGCEFHILNYMRKNKPGAGFVSAVSMDQPLNENGDTASDIIPDRARPIDESLDKEIVVNDIKNNGFSEKEKAVFFMLAEGMTSREVGSKLDMSHVMVLKYKKKVIKSMGRVTRPGKFLLM